MKRLTIAAALAALAAMPLLAMQPGQDKQAKGAPALPRTVHSEMILYQDPNFNGDDFTVETPSTTVHTDWNIRSIAVHPGDRWQICARTRFRDPCIILDRSVPDASMIGVEGQIGSARLAPAAGQ